MGMVNLTLELLQGRPAEIDSDSRGPRYRQTSFEATSSEAWIRVPMDAPAPPFDGPLMLADGLGWYRVRAHALGRELDYDLVVDDEPREHHLLQLWRAAGPEGAQRHRVDNQWAGQGSGSS